MKRTHDMRRCSPE